MCIYVCMNSLTITQGNNILMIQQKIRTKINILSQKRSKRKILYQKMDIVYSWPI